ncbi:glycine cleavage system aminomethyltransferase GcvT [Bacteroidota bacterium]
MKDTALTHIHKELGARIVPFAGYNMPLEYSGIKDEHLAVRNAVGLFDVSHMGEIWIKGPGATELVQKLTTNDVRKLYDGKIQYNCFPNGNGGIIDDILVYKYSEEKFMLVVNASNIQKDWDWINANNSHGVELENSSDMISLLAVQGPRSVDVLQKLTQLDLGNLKYYNFQVAPFAGVEEVIISATGYTGAGGFELYFYNPDAEKIWTAIMEAGAELGIKPAGLAARDTLRLEMGFCLYGNDIDETTSPIEAGLGWITKLTEDNNFIDKERLQKQKEEGPARKLVGFVMIEKGIPRQHYEILSDAGDVVGAVTSGTMSPTMNIGIGMGYVFPEYAIPGSRIQIRIRNKELAAEVVNMPIYKKDKA